MTELPRYERILNGTDGSEASEQATLHAIYLARQLNAQLDVLYVVDVDYHAGIHLGEEALELEREGKTILDKAEGMAREHGVAVNRLEVRGKPGPAIVSLAKERQASLVVVGAHRMGPLERVLLGSTSEYVSQHASVPVLIIR